MHKTKQEANKQEHKQLTKKTNETNKIKHATASNEDKTNMHKTRNVTNKP